MQVKISKLLGNIIGLSLITVTMTYGSNKESLNNLNDKSYQTMSTAQLQEEVEKRSVSGSLSFEMGMELMKRWTKS